jgi:hypothetical protein
MLLVADGRLDDSCVEGVWDQGDDKIVLSDFGVEGLLIGDIERDWVSVLDTLRELLCALKSSASYLRLAYGCGSSMKL